MTTNAPDTALALRPDAHAGLAMVITPSEAVQRLRDLQEFVKATMVDGLDFGTIPGTQKPTLYQPGAQRLAEIYGLAVDFADARPPIERWGSADEEPFFAYFKRAIVTRRGDGLFLGAGIGSCNAGEEKYSGRWVFEREIPPHLDRDRLRVKHGTSKKNGKPFTLYRVPNPAICDLVNTIEKMACKRALVHAIIAVTRSAGIFTQDMEDMSREARGERAETRDGDGVQDAEWEEARGDAPPSTPLDRAKDGTATAADVVVVLADKSANVRVWGWEHAIRMAPPGELDAIAAQLAAEPVAKLKRDMLDAIAKRKAQSEPAAQPAAEPGAA